MRPFLPPAVSVASLFGLAIGLLVSCANPVSPSGGPRDEQPPSIAQTTPVRDTVNVSTSTEALRIEFSEYIERSSLPGALSITPTFEQQPQFSWSGRTVEIAFPSSLRDSTTYIFSFDTNLTDAHGVSLDNPLTVAFSTGSQINRGQIDGTVRAAQWGQPQKGVDVYAYALSPGAESPPAPLPERPSYRTQTGEDGQFGFDYMSEGRYYVVALRDNNRNRQPDVGEPFAVPPRFALRADSEAGDVPVPWLLARRDTTAPRLQRVRSVSRQRFRLSFSEPVRVQSRRPEAWVLRDSARGTRVDVQSLFRVPDRPSTVAVRTAPMCTARHLLSLPRGSIADTLGRPMAPDTARFRAAARDDTVRTRFRAFLPTALRRDSTGARPLLPGVQPGVRFNQTLDSTARRTGLQVQDTTGAARSFSLDTQDGTTYRLRFDPPLAPGQFVDVSVRGSVFARPDTTYRRRYRRVTRRALGALAGRVLVADTTRTGARVGPDGRPDTTRLRLSSALPARTEADTLAVPLPDTSALPSRRTFPDSLFYAGPVAVELVSEEASLPVETRRVITPPGSTFAFEELPDGRFRFRAYLDRNNNGRWDGGGILPYTPAEPVTWLRDPVEARPRWTTELPAPLRIPVLAPVPRRSARPSPDTTRSQPGRRR